MNNTQTSNTAILLCMAAFLCFVSCGQQRVEREGEERLRDYVNRFASPEWEGRLAGTLGEAETANYLTDQFIRIGIAPFGDDGTFLQQFVLDGPIPQAMDIEGLIARNVIGIVNGKDFPGRYIVLGAHYDGQGHGGVISMHTETEPRVHPSADDNASGTAGLLWLAEQFAGERPDVSIIFAAFSGEEQGLLGSKHFVDGLHVHRDSILAMVNLDMIGRLDENTLTVSGAETSTIWADILEQSQPKPDTLALHMAGHTMNSSDHTSFINAGVPALHVYTGTHSDYHRETDTPDKINTAGMAIVLQFVENVLSHISQKNPEDMQFIRPPGAGRDTGNMGGSVRLGVMPDYEFPGTGFRIEQVSSGSVAEQSGLMAGDVIIKIDEKEIVSIYDYMAAMQQINPPATIRFEVERDEVSRTMDVSF